QKGSLHAARGSSQSSMRNDFSAILRVPTDLRSLSRLRVCPSRPRFAQRRVIHSFPSNCRIAIDSQELSFELFFDCEIRKLCPQALSASIALCLGQSSIVRRDREVSSR